MDVTQEIEQRAHQAAQAGADHCALCSISCVTSALASVYGTIFQPTITETWQEYFYATLYSLSRIS